VTDLDAYNASGSCGAGQVLRCPARVDGIGRAAAGRPSHAHRGGAGRGSRWVPRRQAVAREIQRGEPRRRFPPGRDRQRGAPALFWPVRLPTIPTAGGGCRRLAASGEKVYENIGHVLRPPARRRRAWWKETTWVLSIDSWGQHRGPVRRDFYKATSRPRPWSRSGAGRPEFLVEIEVIAAIV